MRTIDDYRYLVSTEDHISKVAFHLNTAIFPDIDERFNELEYLCSKYRKRSEVTRAEKSAILHELGVLDYLASLNIPQNKLASLLCVVLDSSAPNVEKDLSSRHNKNGSFKNKNAYQGVVKRFGELALTSYQEKTQKVLNELTDK
jgi:hypothetical protein